MCLAHDSGAVTKVNSNLLRWFGSHAFRREIAPGGGSAACGGFGSVGRGAVDRVSTLDTAV